MHTSCLVIKPENALLQACAERLRPAAMAAYQATLQSALTAGAEKRKRYKEAAIRALQELHQRWQLYCSGAEWLSEEAATHVALQRHLVRSTGAQTALSSSHRICHVQYNNIISEL